MELNINNSEFVNIGDIEFIQELDTYSFPNRVYEVYRNTTNNKDISYEQAHRKIIRDIVLGVELPKREGIEHKRVFSYGNMLIHLNTEERSICYIKNMKGKIDRNKKIALNNIMGLEDNTYFKNLFIGDLVKLKSNVNRIGKDEKFVQNAIKENWVFLITGIDNEGLDYIIQPIYLVPGFNITQLGARLLVVHDEIEQIKMSRNELFKTLNEQIVG